MQAKARACTFMYTASEKSICFTLCSAALPCHLLWDVAHSQRFAGSSVASRKVLKRVWCVYGAGLLSTYFAFGAKVASDALYSK